MDLLNPAFCLPGRLPSKPSIYTAVSLSSRVSVLPLCALLHHLSLPTGTYNPDDVVSRVVGQPKDAG